MWKACRSSRFTQQPQKTGGKIYIPVSVQRDIRLRDDHFFSASHPFDDCEGVLPTNDAQRDHRRSVRERWADDRDRETVLLVGLHQPFLTGDFVPRILPVGVFQRGVFRDQVMQGWFLIGAGRADENILALLSLNAPKSRSTDCVKAIQSTTSQPFVASFFDNTS